MYMHARGSTECMCHVESIDLVTNFTHAARDMLKFFHAASKRVLEYIAHCIQYICGLTKLNLVIKVEGRLAEADAHTCDVPVW